MARHDNAPWRRDRIVGTTLGFLISASTILAACGDDTNTGGTGGVGGSGASGTGGTPVTTGGAPPEGGGGNGTGGDGTGGSPNAVCTTDLPAENRSSPVALSPDNKILVVANRDVGSVSVFDVAADGTVTKTAEVVTGADTLPWSVSIDGCSDRAFVALRNSDQVVAIESLKSNPFLGDAADVGAEPTGVALAPDNGAIYSANWVEGTVSVIDPATMSVTDTFNLNETLAGTGYLGNVQSRPALAHPRAIAVNADGSEIYVSEWFGQRVAPDGANGANADTSHHGIVYRITTANGGREALEVPAVADTTILDHNSGVTGCYPNQLGAIAVSGSSVYVSSTCASPKGPLGVLTTNAVCTVATQELNCGFGGTCNANTLTCNPNKNDTKTTTHPALSIIDTANGDAATTTNLDKTSGLLPVPPVRLPLLPTDITVNGGFVYLTAEGADAIFRMQIDGTTITSISSGANSFIDLRFDSNDKNIRLPIGFAASTDASFAFGFVANEGQREVESISLDNQNITGSPDAPVAAISAVMPTGEELKQLKGKRFFTTGLGRWSLNGAAWGSCAACHVDGLSDNVTWYFNRGPRQSVSLDGSFATGDPTDQRIFNWTGIFDEVADFEGNVRGVSGGLGAIVDATNVAINTATQSPPQQGLQGNSDDLATPAGAQPGPHSNIDDWVNIKAYVQSIRSPRKPVGLDAADVSAGHDLFVDANGANCIGCHSGPKWTISQIFYKVSSAGANQATGAGLSTETWNVNLNGFPSELFPVDAANFPANAFNRFGAPPGAEQLQCSLRPVGTFPASGNVSVAPTDVGVAELRQDMATLGQGGAATGRGFNIPSLLGMQVGAPYFHAGNARTLEELFDDTLFSGHHASVIASGALDSDAKRQLVAFILSIEETDTPLDIPAKGDKGGSLCVSAFQ